MPDICMCSNHFCPSKLLCYRYMAIWDTYQTYAKFEVKEGEDKCDHFVKIDKGDRIRKTDDET